jgi:hypothetical protein
MTHRQNYSGMLSYFNLDEAITNEELSEYSEFFEISINETVKITVSRKFHNNCYYKDQKINVVMQQNNSDAVKLHHKYHKPFRLDL